MRPRIFLEGNFFVDLKPGTARTTENLNDGRLHADDADVRRRYASSTGPRRASKPTRGRTSRSSSTSYAEIDGGGGATALRRSFKPTRPRAHNVALASQRAAARRLRTTSRPSSPSQRRRSGGGVE